MLGISRYVMRQLAVGIVMVAVALVCVVWLTQSLRFIELIVNKGLSLARFLELTMLLMPSFLVIVVPVALFTVTLFTYSKLTSDRELVVMRVAGLSHWALSQPALILATAATALGFVLSLWFIPWTVRSFHEMQWTIRNDITNVLLQEGVFNKFGEGVTIYIASRTNTGELLGLLVHDRRNAEKPVTLIAERGALVRSDNGPRVLMIHGSRQQVSGPTGKLTVLDFDRYSLDLEPSSSEGGGRVRDAREMTLGELMRANPERLDSSEYRKAKVELHQRFTSPFYNLGLTLIALACLIPAHFNRRGNSAEIARAVSLMVVCEALSLLTSNLSTANLRFTPLMYATAILPIVAGIWILLEQPNPFSRLQRSFASP